MVTIWESTIAAPNTQKLHCVRAHNSKQLYVSSASRYNDFFLVGILKGVVSNEEEEDSVHDSPIPIKNLNVNSEDWILVKYDGRKLPGKVTNIIGLDFMVNVMQKSLGAFGKWPQILHVHQIVSNVINSDGKVFLTLMIFIIIVQ